MKPKPFWVLKNLTVPIAIAVPLRFVGRQRVHREGGNIPSFGEFLECAAQPKTGKRVSKM
jgi:hypothetical protein